MSVDPVRRLALDILVQVAAGRRLDTLLDEALTTTGAARPSGFLVELVKGCLRWQGRYDHLIRSFSRRKFPEDIRVVCVLRLGMHQLVACSGVPTYAAIHQAGELGRLVGGERVVPYINGVLQALSRHLHDAADAPEEAIRPLFPQRESDPAGYLATYLSHPRWLVDRWLTRFGLVNCERLCRHNNQIPELVLHVLAPVEPDALMARLRSDGLDVRRGHHERALVLQQRLARAELVRLLAREKDLIVQDEAAQAATAWLARGGRGRLLDLCAAPGGKTFHLRSIWPDPQNIVAMDRQWERLALLRQTAKRIVVDDLDVLLADGLTPPFAAGRFDAVLLDGPCTGSGVMRHHPEGRWRLRPEDLARYRDRLLALGQQAVRLLVAGGRLLYVTCSLEPEENEELLAALQKAEPGLVPDAFEGAWQRTWLPHEEGSDGFFAARLYKKGSAP